MNTKSQDTNPKPAANSVVETITQKLRDLGAEYKGARDTLYKILEKCFALAIEIDGDDDQVRELENYLKRMKRPFNGGTSIYAKVIKAIVDIDRKPKELSHAKISKYATVLVRAAVAQKRPADLVEWIKAERGIEAIVANANKSSNEKSDKFEYGKQLIRERNVVGTIRFIAGLDTDEELVLLIGRPDGLGGIDILDFCPDQGGLTTICKKASKTLSVDADEGEDADDSGEDSSTTANTQEPVPKGNEEVPEECTV